MYCHQCGKELIEPEEHEPYPRIVVECDIFCMDCIYKD